MRLWYLASHSALCGSESPHGPVMCSVSSTKVPRVTRYCRARVDTNTARSSQYEHSADPGCARPSRAPSTMNTTDRPPPPRSAPAVSFSNTIRTTCEPAETRIFTHNTNHARPATATASRHDRREGRPVTLLDARDTRAHGSGVDLYLTDRMARDSTFPFEPGATVVCQTVPNQAVVILPANTKLRYPVELTLREPSERRIDPGVDPANIPLLDTQGGEL